MDSSLCRVIISVFCVLSEMRSRKAPQKTKSPVVTSAKKVKKKYSKGFPITPSKSIKTKRALFEVSDGQSIMQSAKKYGLSYWYLHRRVTGVVEHDKRNGPEPFLSADEEETIANYISEMAQRGMGLRRADILNLVQTFLQKEKRKNPFKDSRPGKRWYYLFLHRHRDKLEPRQECQLETSRAKVTAEQMDKWFDGYKTFLSERDLLDKPHRVYNADETGFTMGSKPGKVIGPPKLDHKSQIPHVPGGSTKQRFTVMYCANAEGYLMPPFFVYPEPQPSAYDPLLKTIRGSKVAYTQKGWMDSRASSQFIDHFDEFAGPERPVVLLFDSVSSHINIDTFSKAASKGIELYRLVPNATHLVQPLDKGVFGPLKTAWYTTVRKNTRENPGQPIGKRNFAAKLAEANLAFYKPSIIINSFRSSGIYPVSREAVPNDRLKPSITYSDSKPVSGDLTESPDTNSSKRNSRCSNDGSKVADDNKADELLKMYSAVLGTPMRERYDEKLNAGHDLNESSPGLMLYKKLKENIETKIDNVIRQKDNISSSINTALCSEDETTRTPVCKEESQHPCAQEPVIDRTWTGLDILANAAEQVFRHDEERNVKSFENKKEKDAHQTVSPILKEMTTLPRADPPKEKAPRLLDKLPDAVSSREAIRKMALASLKTAREKAEKEIKAKARYIKAARVKAEKEVKAKARAVRTNETKTKSLSAREKVKKEIKAKAKTAREKVEQEIRAKTESFSQIKEQGKRRANTAPTKLKNQRSVANDTQQSLGNNCQVCLGTEKEDESAGIETTWLQCDRCDRWVHSHCLPVNFEFDYGVFVPDSSVDFTCHNCSI